MNKDIFITAKITMKNVAEDELVKGITPDDVSNQITQLLFNELPEDDRVKVNVTTEIKDHEGVEVSNG